MSCNCPRSSYGIKHTPECYDALTAELADWMRMRNEAMAVATSNRARIRELESQDEIHWKTRRTLLAERDRLAAELTETQRQLKLVSPIGKYNGRDIEGWAKHAGELESALREVRTTGVFSVKHTDLWARIDALLPISKSQQKRFEALTSVEPIKGGQLCHLCNAVHDLMSACPPSYLAKMSSAESLPCENCGHSVDEHFGIGLPCPTNDRGVAK